MTMTMTNAHTETAPGQSKTYDIIVNGRPKTVTDKKLTFLQVVQLAFPGEVPTDQIIFTVTYSKPNGKDGSLVEGEEVRIKDGVIFNVRKTDKS